jgi:outer membrane immunogenic protein
MKKLALAALIAAPLLAPVAMAETELYLNGGIAAIDGDGATLQAVTVRGGVAFHELLGAELEASFGIGAEELDDDLGAEIELENQFGGYLVARYPVLPGIEALGRIGYTTGEFQASASGISGDVEIDGFAFGFGGEFMVTDQFGIRGDYTRIEADDEDLDGGVNVFALTGVYRFGSIR